MSIFKSAKAQHYLGVHITQQQARQLSLVSLSLGKSRRKILQELVADFLSQHNDENSIVEQLTLSAIQEFHDQNVGFAGMDVTQKRELRRKFLVQVKSNLTTKKVDKFWMDSLMQKIETGIKL